MPYAQLPWEVPGVTCPLPLADGGLAAEGPGTEPVLLRGWPVPARPEQQPRSPRRPATHPGRAITLPPAVSELLEGLSAEQRQAVMHGEGPLLIRAGAGTGKTETLTRRIAYLLEQGIARPHEVLAVTFTRSAAEEMRQRVIGLIGTAGARGITVCTIHKLCDKLVRAHAGEFGRDKEYVICNRPMVERIARAIIAGEGCKAVCRELERRGEQPLTELLEQISLAKNLLWSVEDFTQLSQHPARGLVAALWRELEAQLRAANGFDFEDLLVCAAALLRRERLREHYRERYRWMAIDEFHNVNRAQMEVVRLLMAPNGNLTAVGDEDQGLYAWRGAEPENMLNFTADFPDAQTVTLTLNRRSRSEILDVALNVIAHNKARTPKELISLRGAGGFVGARLCATDAHEANHIAGLIETDLAIGRNPGEIFVLCSRREPLRYLQPRFEERGIDVQMLGEPSLLERSEILDAVAYLQLLTNPYDSDAYERAVTAPRDRKTFSRGRVKAPTRGIDRSVWRIVQFAQELGVDLIKATLRADEIAGVPASAVAALREFAAALDSNRDALDHVCNESWSREPECPSLAAVVAQTLKIAGGPVQTYAWLRDHAQNRIVREEANRVIEDLCWLLRRADGYEQTTTDAQPTIGGFLESLGASDRVTFATIYGAQGMEAETVIVIGTEDGLLPDSRSSLEDERKVFCAAAMRAKENLLFTHVATRNGVATQGPSRFLGEAGLL